MAIDAEGEADGVAAGNRAVLAEAVGVFDFAQVGSRLAVDGVHEELFGFLAIFPSHCGPPVFVITATQTMCCLLSLIR